MMQNSSANAHVDLSSFSKEDPVLVCACDDHYAMPLSVTLKSVGQSLTAGRCVNVVLLDGGISETSWSVLNDSLTDEPIKLVSLRPDCAALAHLPTSYHITHSAYFRLLCAEWLPASLDKVIYLDSDTLVLSSLTEIWDIPIEDNYCLACVDIACPFIDARRAARHPRRSCPYMASLCPIPNFEQLGMRGDRNYFNSGVMVLNLDLWRRDNIGQRLIQCMEENEAHVWCWDQYALNVVFFERWGQLPLRWNQGVHAFEYPSIDHSPVDPSEFVEMLNNPAIVHFTTEFKPWKKYTIDPRSDLFYDVLDRTAWTQERPRHTPFVFHDWWNRRRYDIFRHLTITGRKVSAIWS